MSSARKIFKAMIENPKDWSIDQVRTVATAFGMTMHCSGGSHHIVRDAQGRKLSIPAHRPIKPVYIRNFTQLIQKNLQDVNDD